METISHRELRNQSGRVLAAVEAGESFTVTNHGKPVAVLVPISEDPPGLPLARPAVRQGGLDKLKRYTVTESVQDALDELRGDR